MKTLNLFSALFLLSCLAQGQTVTVSVEKTEFELHERIDVVYQFTLAAASL